VDSWLYPSFEWETHLHKFGLPEMAATLAAFGGVFIQMVFWPAHSTTMCGDFIQTSPLTNFWKTWNSFFRQKLSLKWEVKVLAYCSALLEFRNSALFSISKLQIFF
jgi:hypothetical protein